MSPMEMATHAHVALLDHGFVVHLSGGSKPFLACSLPPIAVQTDVALGEGQKERPRRGSTVPIQNQIMMEASKMALLGCSPSKTLSGPRCKRNLQT